MPGRSYAPLLAAEDGIERPSVVPAGKPKSNSEVRRTPPKERARSLLSGEGMTMDRRETDMSERTVETPVLDLLTSMTKKSFDATTLDAEKLILVRIAALVAIDAPPASYLMNLGAADEVGVGPEEIQGVLTAVAPIVGTAKVVSATGKIVRALGLAIDLEEFEGLAETEDTPR
jgi:alkylhydroperoxidase/carboxymuconolactone decarboxylase family protein YurZ